MSMETTNEREVDIPAQGIFLSGSLGLCREGRGVIVFAHGSGSSRFSPRNRHVAEAFRRAGLGTLLIDLLTQEEADDRRNVFDIELLASRLSSAALWLQSEHATKGLGIGYFGSSTGAAAALLAAARHPDRVGAIVSRGGRPDLAWADLSEVRSPTLLIVGGEDTEVLELNRRALAKLQCPREIIVIPGATHLFPEPGALDEVTRLAENWFLRHLGPEVYLEIGNRVSRSDLDALC
jgi:pimeloyl-ACP methyl ester carboxylesterase